MDIVVTILRGLLGMAAMVGILFLLSNHRKKINWKLVASGLGLQLIFGFLVLKVDVVRSAIDTIASGFAQLLLFTDEGTNFLVRNFGDGSIDPVFTNFLFRVLPTIIFFSALASLLYYFGILQFITKGIAWVMSKTMRLTGAESLAAAANVFIGQTEAPLVIKPYLENMSRSEIMCLMTGGFATIAGSVFVSYISFLGGDDPETKLFFARHLLTASIMSAPAAIVAAKIISPTLKELSLTEQKLNVPRSEAGSNVLDAITQGTSDGLRLAVNVGVMLLVFTAMVALVNALLANWIGSWTGLNLLISEATNGQYETLSLEYILGLAFSPIAWLLGIEWGDCMMVGQLLGFKTTINEFYAYAQLKEAKELISERSLIITTYALCGFANFASIGIQIGGIGALAPGQRKNLTELALKAMIGGTIAAFFTAIIAGILV